MPTYEYECEACQHAFEQFQAMSDAPLKVCPSCKKRKLIRLIGAGAGIIFKGSGFYETDYKRKASPTGKDEGKTEGKTEGATADKKPEAKSEAKAETKAEAKPGSKAESSKK